MSLNETFDHKCLADVPPYLLDLIQSSAPIESQAHAPVADAARLPLKLDEISIDGRTKRLIIDGDTNGEHPSRSETLFAVICALIRAGYDDETVFATVWDPAHKISEKPREKGEAWLRGEIVRARAKTPPVLSLPGSPEWPSPLEPEAFHGLAGDIIKTIEPHTEADSAALLLQLLTMVGNAADRSAHYRVEGDSHRANLFSLVVGETSKSRKGTSFGRVRQLLELADNIWAMICVVSGLSTGEGLIWQVRDPSSENDEGALDKRLLVVEPEFASTLKVMGREGNSLSPVIRQAWDRGNLRSMTKNSPARATGAHISIIGHITKDELRRYLNATEAGNGFANRFLFVCSRRSKVLPFGGDLTDDDLQPLADRLIAVMEFARGVEEPIQMNDAAQALWRDVYPALSEGQPGLFGAVTSRAEAQVIRLALIYAVLDRSSVIIAEHLKAALAVWRYCEASARYIFGEALGDPTADEILAALRASPSGLTRTEISDLFKRHKSRNVIAGALASLQEHGLVHYKTEPTGGRPTETWLATLEE